MIDHNFFSAKTDEELRKSATEFAIAQEKMAARSQEDSQHWHHIAVHNLLLELAKRMKK